MHYDAPSEAAAAKAARLESGRDCICQMALIHYCLHCMLFFTQILQDCCPQIPYRYDTNSVIFFQPVASVSVSLFSKVLSAIFWMILVIFRGLLIPMRCVADLHFCLASGVLGGGVSLPNIMVGTLSAFAPFTYFSKCLDFSTFS